MSQKTGTVSGIGTAGTFLTKDGCSETLFSVLNGAFGHPLREEERASAPLSGGVMQHGYQCGMVWGAALAAGAQAHRLHGPGPKAETLAILASRRAAEVFRARNGTLDCQEITELNASSTNLQLVTYFLLKGGVVGCLSMAGKYAPAAHRAIEAALAEEPAGTPAAPVSCAALLARKMGASEAHATMAAGLAGGIGLTGGACGALGAAIWITGMDSLKGGARRVAYKSPGALDVLRRFLECTDYEFECSKIVGRTFGDVGDHACHVCAGGCSRLLEALATT